MKKSRARHIGEEGPGDGERYIPKKRKVAVQGGGKPG